MPYCQKCKSEFVEGIKVCSDCNTPLVDSLPEEPEVNFDELVCIYSCDQFYEAEMLKDNLESAGIAAQILSQKDRNYPGAGDLSVVKVFVDIADEDAAKEFVDSISETCSEGEDE